MKILRNIAFLLSLLVMIGHDIVPHVHEAEAGHHHDHDLELPHGDFEALPASLSSSELELEHAFAHVQHSQAEKHLVYVSSPGKKASIPVKFFADNALPQSMAGPVWYANLKKQLFWTEVTPLSSCLLHSFSLRGPPAC